MFCGLHHTDEQELDVRLDPTRSSFVQTKDVVQGTYRNRWTIKTNGEGESEKSLPTARYEDD